MKFLERHTCWKSGLQRLRNAFPRKGPVPHQNDAEVAENQHYSRKPEQHNLFDVHGAADHSGRYFLLMQAQK
jgi:hypothetical protein